MKIAVFSPYGVFGNENGLLYLVANFLLRQGAEGIQLRCDGAVNACGRDGKHGWNRTLFTCSRCVAEQRVSAEWANVRGKPLSSFLLPDDVMQVKRWISTVPSKDVRHSEFRGVPLWDLCKVDFLARFGEVDLAAASVQQDAALRDLYVSAVQTLVAADRFVTTVAPTLHLIAGKGDTLSAAYTLTAKQSRVDGAVFWYDRTEEVVAIESLTTGARYSTKLMIENISMMRPDPKTWAPEVTAIVYEMLTFLGLGPDKTQVTP